MSKHYRPLTDIHIKIRFLRKHLNLNQKDHADHLGISQRAYSKIENNQTNIHLDHLSKIAACFAVPVEDLFTFTEQELILQIFEKDIRY